MNQSLSATQTELKKEAEPKEVFSSFNQWKSIIDRLPYLSQLSVAREIRTYIDSQYAIFAAVKGAQIKDLTYNEFYRVFSQFLNTLKNSSLSSSDAWLNATVIWKQETPQLPAANAVPQAPGDSFFNPGAAMQRQHFVQRLLVPIGSRVLLHGDLHGDVHSLVSSIEPYMASGEGFKLKDNVYLIFLGDYVDRGLYGLECIYTLMRLKIDNPDRVFMVRGNHEDSSISNSYGFNIELSNKGFNQQAIATVYRLYDVLPVALYLGSGTNFVQLCHGGLETGYLPTALLNAPEKIEYEWINELNRATVFSRLDDNMDSVVTQNPDWFKDHTIPAANSTVRGWINTKIAKDFSLGFMWNDFAVNPIEDVSIYCGRGFTLNKNITEQLLQLSSTGKNKLCGVCRAHQHTPQPDAMMSLLLDLANKDEANKGIAKLWSSEDKKGITMWQNIVVTFNICPDTLYGIPHPGFGYAHRTLINAWPGFDFDTMGELITHALFNQWKLIVHRKKITNLQPITNYIRQQEEERIKKEQELQQQQQAAGKVEEEADVCSWR